MAKTKFLDYTGLAKLVEKIKNTYVNIGGSTMTGTLKTFENQPAINFRPNNSGYSVTLNYDTESAEALAINLKNPSTSFMINSGVDGTTWTGEGHQSKVTPTIQVRKNCVSINKYIADNITPEYKLDVNGDVKANSFTGKLNGNANTASKLGTATVGGATKPMYLNGGTPTECTYTLAQNVTSTSKLTDHLYNAGEGLKLTTGTTADTFSLSAATSSTIGGVKIGNNISITSGTISLTKGNVVNALGYTPPTADTNTHYTTGLIVGNSSSSTGNTAVTTNGVFLNLKDDNHIRNSHKIVGGGATTVTSDSGGTITISSTDKKVYQEVDTTSIGVTPLLLSPLSEDTKTGETYFTTSAKINFNIVAVPKSGTLKATHFIGTTFSGDTFSGTTFTGNAATATSAITATYAKQYSYNGFDRDFVYDVVDGGNHYIRCKDATIVRANGTNLNKYEFIINSDGKGGCYIYDGANAKGTTWSPDGISFEKAPANSLVAANGTFVTAISDTDIKNEINSAIDWTQAL